MSGSRVVAILKEYKEILILLAAIGGVASFVPRSPTPAATLESISAKLDSMNRQLDALVRVQCTTDARLTQLAGVRCP